MAAPKKFSKPTPVPVQAAPAPAPIVERSQVKASGTLKTPAAAPRFISQDAIARRAYEIFASRGYAPGDQHADWIEAERQLKAGL